MPDYYDPYRRQTSTNRYKSIGSGYVQDLTTGQVGYYVNNKFRVSEDNPTENLYEQKFKQKNQFKQDLSNYDTAAMEFRDQLLRGFQQSSEYQGARASGGVAANVNQFAQRRGLGDDFTAALNAEQQGKMRSQILQTNMDFETKLNSLLQSERLGFLKGEFDFFHRLQAMDEQAALSERMLRFQQDLQNDQFAKNLFGDMLQIGGTILGGMIGGPAGAAVGYGATSGL